MKRLSIWFELWLTACLLISPCHPRGVELTEPARPGPAPERAPAPGPGAAAVEWGRAQPGQAFLSGRGRAAPCPAYSVCRDQVQVPRALPSVPPEPRARLRRLPACGLPCAQCGQTRTLWGAGVPWGSGTCPRACLQGGSPGAGVPPVCSPHPASSCPPPHGPSASRGPASAAASLTPPRPCGAAWGLHPI